MRGSRTESLGHHGGAPLYIYINVFITDYRSDLEFFPLFFVLFLFLCLRRTSDWVVPQQSKARKRRQKAAGVTGTATAPLERVLYFATIRCCCRCFSHKRRQCCRWRSAFWVSVYYFRVEMSWQRSAEVRFLTPMKQLLFIPTHNNCGSDNSRKKFIVCLSS